MAESTKKSVWWAVERLGLPTVLVAALWFANYQQTQRLMDEAAKREAAAASLLLTTLNELQTGQVSLVNKLDGNSKAIAALTTDIRTASLQVADHERRLTRREDNQYTIQDGAKVQLQVTEHGTILAKHSDAISGISKTMRRLEEAVNRLTHAVEAKK